MTYDQFEKKYIGKAVDYDNVASVQCVDLFDQYIKDCFGITGVWCNGAKDLYNKFDTYPDLVKAFKKIPNTPDLVVKKGDVVIWGGGSWGHVGIGNGQGDTKYFISLEENTLGQHEPTQLVKHYFNGSGGNDGCNPVLGVLRPKNQDKINGVTVLDKSGFKKGDKGLGVYALKQRLIALGYSMKSDSGFGEGTEKAVNNLLKKWGHKQNGIAGEKFIKKVMKK